MRAAVSVDDDGIFFGGIEVGRFDHETVEKDAVTGFHGGKFNWGKVILRQFLHFVFVDAGGFCAVGAIEILTGRSHSVGIHVDVEIRGGRQIHHVESISFGDARETAAIQGDAVEMALGGRLFCGM